MQLYELPKSELKEFDQEGVIEGYEALMSKMSKAVDRKTIAVLKDEELRELHTMQKKKGNKVMQMHVDRIMHGQPQGLQTQIFAPIDEIKEKIVQWGMTTKSPFMPKSNGICYKYHDVAIIDYYNSKAKGLLEFYSVANNFHEVKRLVNYHMRWSLLHTLAGKHLTKV